MPLNIEKFRERILAEKTRLESDRLRIKEHEDMSQELGELSDFDPNHPGDMGSEMFEREKDMALHENLDSLLVQVNLALTKLDNGSYGLCDRCGKPIAESRLQALPYATLCIVCQSLVENEL